MEANPEDVLATWFGEGVASPERVTERARLWFAGDPAFDALLRERFAGLPARAQRGELDAWKESARSALALVLVLDQLPRNLYRDTAECFAYDGQACAVAAAAMARGFDAELTPLEATFLYLPLEHAEDIGSQEQCVSLFGALLGRAPEALHPQFEQFLAYAERHRDVIRRFGRFPHRNAALGRASTPEEIGYLDSGGERFGGSEK